MLLKECQQARRRSKADAAVARNRWKNALCVAPKPESPKAPKPQTPLASVLPDSQTPSAAGPKRQKDERSCRDGMRAMSSMGARGQITNRNTLGLRNKPMRDEAWFIPVGIDPMEI